MAEKHTSGPWHVKDPNGSYIDQDPSRRSISYRPISVESVSTGRICYVGDGSPFLPNARLIAAAPKLLAALKSARGAIEYMQPLWEKDLLGAKVLTSLNAIDAAIAEALGEPS